MPSAIACFPTASATTSAIARESARGGRRSAVLSFRVGDSVASALAEAMIIESDTRLAREVRMPRARPGKIYELLVWAIRIVWPLIFTGSNGLPLPTSARPSVQVSRFAGVASEREVGFDRGKITG